MSQRRLVATAAGSPTIMQTISEARAVMPEWHVVHTHPRQENRAAKNLSLWKIELFSPAVRLRNGSESRRQERIEPLFPGYIFARFDSARMLHNIRFTRGVHSVITFAGKPAPVHDDIIALCRSRIGPDGYAQIARDLKPGEAVVIQSGPFKNMVAIFEKEMPGRLRARVLLTTIQWRAHLQLDACDIARVVRPSTGATNTAS